MSVLAKLTPEQIAAFEDCKTKEEIEILCDRDHWMKPEEAIAHGFIDMIVE